MSTPGPIYEFSGFRLDCGRFELLRIGRPLRVERKPLELLILLASRQGQLVTRAEIAHHLWSSEVFVDTEHGINTAIRKLRHLLHDNPEDPRFIQTVTGMGYRFIAPIAMIEPYALEIISPAASGDAAPLAPETSAAVAIPPQIHPPRRPRLWVSIAAAALLALAGGLWYVARPRPRLRVAGYRQITHDGRIKFPVGTDGARLYFNWQNASPAIGEVAVDGGDSVNVPVPLPQPGVADVARDGSSILVGSNDGSRFSLWKMQTPGGALRRVAGNDTIGDASSVALSPDNRSLAFSTVQGDIFVMRDDGTHVRRLSHPPGTATNYRGDDITWSPDGRKIRFTWNHRFWEIASDGSRLRPLLSGWRPASWECCGHWTSDGQFFIFLLRDTFSNPLFSFGQLWALDERPQPLRPAPAPTQLTYGPMRWATPIPGINRREVFARGVVLRGELVRYDAPSKQFQPMFRGISAESVSYSPDGKSVVYVSFPEGILWRANSDGSNPVQLTRPPLYPLNPNWSSDGAKILFFDVGFGARSHVYTISASGGAPVRLRVKNGRREETDPSWSPDGLKIAFASGGPISSPDSNIQILDLSTHQTTKIAGSDGMWSPRWSPTGRQLAALTATSSLAVFNMDSQQWAVLDTDSCGYPTWSRDGRYLYFMQTSNGAGLYRVPASGGRPKRFVDLSDFRSTGAVGIWMGLDPHDAPMLIRDTGTDDIYALTLDQK